MPEYKPRNRNVRYDTAPLSWSQRYYDRPMDNPAPCGFRDQDRKQ